MRAFTSSIACASASARCRSTRSIWNARRWAVFGPTPGRRESSVISLSSGSGSCGTRSSLLQEARRQAHAARQGLHLRGRVLARPVQRLVDGREHEVLQQVDVFHRPGVDRHGDQLLRAGGHDLHGTTTRRPLDSVVLELLLQLRHAVLHLLHLAQHLHRVFHSLTSLTLVTRPSNRRTTSRTNGSSSGLAAFAGFGASAGDSRRRYSTFTSGPSHARTCGSSCADCSCAFLWWKP